MAVESLLNESEAINNYRYRLVESQYLQGGASTVSGNRSTVNMKIFYFFSIILSFGYFDMINDYTRRFYVALVLFLSAASNLVAIL